MTLSYNLAYQEIILVHPTRRQIFAGKPYSTFWNIWEWVISIWRGFETWLFFFFCTCYGNWGCAPYQSLIWLLFAFFHPGTGVAKSSAAYILALGLFNNFSAWLYIISTLGVPRIKPWSCPCCFFPPASVTRAIQLLAVALFERGSPAQCNGCLHHLQYLELFFTIKCCQLSQLLALQPVLS